MAIEYSETIPPLLAAYLRSGEKVFRRRIVIGTVNGQPQLLCCTVECFPASVGVTPRVSQSYDKCELIEDWLTLEECGAFAQQLQDGVARFGRHTLSRTGSPKPNWTQERVPFNNRSMRRAGVVVTLRMSAGGTIGEAETLLNVSSAYYPDLTQAAKDWIPLVQYAGVSDGRNYYVTFLLPESRAYIESAEIDPDEKLQLVVGGDQAELAQRVKGAYWLGDEIHQIDCDIQLLRTHVAIPRSAQRLDFYLLGNDGTVYDFHLEDSRYAVPQGRRLLGGHPVPKEQRVREAVAEGEGIATEFKPFVGPTERFTRDSLKTKFREVVTSVVAFANAGGGTVYLGIEDDCTIKGVDAQLAAWVGAAPDEKSIQRYLSMLKGRIRDAITGQIDLAADHVRIDGVLVITIHVAQSAARPVCVVGDQHLYVRKSGTNRKVPPDEWQTHVALRDRPSAAEVFFMAQS